MEPEVWEVPAVVEKADISPLHELKGSIGTVPMADAAGPQFDCEVTFLGFVGARKPDGKYHGVYRFGPVDDPEAEHEKFTVLPGSGVAVQQVVVEESEADDDG